MAKPKLALIPAAQGDKFYSVLPSDGVGDFDFTRNSSATRIAPTGFIQEVGAFGSELASQPVNLVNDFSNNSGGVIVDADTFTTSGGTLDGIVAKTNIISLTVGKTYTIQIEGNTTSSGFTLGSGNGTGNEYGSGFGTHIFVSLNIQLWIRQTTSGTTNITKLTIKEVVGNKSRLNYDLLNGKVVNCPHYILEPASTNIFQYSEDFSNSYWNTSRIETTYIADTISPDGTLNAYTLEMSSGQSNGGGVFKTGISISGDNSFSVFAKKKTANYLVLSDTGTTSNAVYFDLQNGIVGTTYNATGEIKDFGNGWYRCTMKYTLTSSGAKFIYLSNLDGSTTGTVQGGDSIYIFGAQLEQSSYPTSYIPTNGTAITRAAESADGSGNAATFNDSEGVLMLEISRLNKADSSSEIISINDGSLSNYITLYYDSNGVAYVLYGSTERSGNFSMSANNQAIFNKIALKYKSQDISLFVNGFEVDTNSGTLGLSGLNSLEFNHGNDAFDFYGKAKQIQYFDSVLTDAQLETLTSWTSLQEMITSQLYTNY